MTDLIDAIAAQLNGSADFLCGAGPNENGNWFHDLSQTERGGFWWRKPLREMQALQNARIAELEAAIKRQSGAAKTLRNSTLAEVQHIKDNERKQYLAIKTLDSEREANAILTEENEALQARITELGAQNRELALQIISSDGQAVDAYDAQKEAEQRTEQLAAQLEAAEAKLAKLAKAEDGLRECEREIDDYIRQEYPHDHPVQERYRQRDFAANPARATLAELKGDNATPTTHRQRGGYTGGV